MKNLAITGVLLSSFGILAAVYCVHVPAHFKSAALSKKTSRKIASDLANRGIDCAFKDLQEQGPSPFQPYVCQSDVIVPTTLAAAKAIDAAYANQQLNPNKRLFMKGTSMQVGDQNVVYVFDAQVDPE